MELYSKLTLTTEIFLPISHYHAKRASFSNPYLWQVLFSKDFWIEFVILPQRFIIGKAKGDSLFLAGDFYGDLRHRCGRTR